MVTSERSRHELYTKLEEVLGPVHTDTLMDHLPPAGWGDVATRQDLRHVRGEVVELRGEVAELRGEVTALRGEVTALRGQVSGEVAALRGDTHALEARLMSRLHRALWLQTAALLAVVLGAVVGLPGS